MTMVGSVQSSVASSAYSQTARSSGSNTERTPVEEPKETRRSEESEGISTKRASEAESSTRPDDTTQLQSRNETETLQTEQTRGSLLDVAV